MTTEELSNEFDVLVDSFLISENFGESKSPLKFDEYEKSVFLTKSLESLISSLYNGRMSGDSFEKTEELRRYLNELVKTDFPEKTDGDKLTNNSYLYRLKPDVWFITYEAVISDDKNLGCAINSTMEVVPVTQDELHKTLNNPFRKPNRRRVLRLDSDGIVELISEYSISKYLIRYLAKPKPIILTDLPNGLTINGDSKETKELKLNPAIYRVILEMAVNLALKSRSNAGK